MDPLAKQFLQELRLSPLFKSAMQEIKKFRPVVPAYQPGSPEEIESLLERVKYESGRLAGFDLIYLVLTGDRNE